MAAAASRLKFFSPKTFFPLAGVLNFNNFLLMDFLTGEIWLVLKRPRERKEKIVVTRQRERERKKGRERGRERERT